MKKSRITIVVMLIMILGLTSGLIIGCDVSLEKNYKKLLDIGYINELVPELGYEWLTPYKNDKPTAIIFAGKTLTADKFSIELDKNVYTSQILSSQIEYEYDTIKSWVNMGYNVAIFRYEMFACDTLENNFKNAYSTENMKYFKDNEFKKIKLLKHNLSDLAFVKLLQEDKEFKEELRFVGNGTGAAIALNVAQSALDYYKAGLSPEKIIPNRIALTNPYLKNQSIKGQTSLSLMLEDVSLLRSAGVALEMIENTKPTMYKDDYSESDLTAYAEIKSKVAYLEYRNNFYKKFGTLVEDNDDKEKEDVYQYNDTQLYHIDNIAFNYYMQSIKGSDTKEFSASDSNKGPNNSLPILDRRDNYYSYSRARFGVSAWTPTTYIYAVGGIQYHSAKEDYKEGYIDYTSTHFMTEIYQVSRNLNDTVICGFIFNDKNKDGVINERPTSYLRRVEVIISYTSNTDEEIIVGSAYSDESGFYSIRIDTSYYEKTLTIRIDTPNYNFSYGEYPVDKNDFAKMFVNVIGKDSNTEYLSINKEYKSVYIKNCGFVPYE